MEMKTVSEKEVIAWLINLFVNTMMKNGFDVIAAKKEVVKRYVRSDQFDLDELVKFEEYADNYSEEDIENLKNVMEMF